MTEQDGTMVGKNGVKISDAGECWRAHSGLDIANPQPVDYQTRDGRKNGVRYFLGPNKMTGEMKIAWIDYPKSMTTLEHLLDDPDVVDTITYCNVCNAMNQIASRPTRSESRSESSIVRPSLAPRRVSLGDVVSSNGPSQLPKDLTAGINIGKSLGLRPTGNAIVTLGLSILSDLASGMVQDPSYRSALQSFSDDMVDTLTPDLISSIKSDAVKIAEAMERDHTALMSREFFSKHMLKSSTDLKNELIASDDRSKQIPSGQSHSISPVYIGSPSRPLRIWE